MYFMGRKTECPLEHPLDGNRRTALIIGSAPKSTLANLISGLSLAVYRPFRIGYVVEIENEYGTVEDITLRHTIVRTWQHKRLIIPNEKLDNMSLITCSIIDARILRTIEMGVSYDAEIDLDRRLILDGAAKSPYRDLKSDDPWVRVISHGDFRASASGCMSGCPMRKTHGWPDLPFLKTSRRALIKKGWKYRFLAEHWYTRKTCLLHA